MNTTMNTNQLLPTEWNPTEVEHFIGPGKVIAQRLVNCAAMCKPRNAAVALLLVGPSGSGKTTLARFAMNLFLTSKWNLSEFFGSDLSVEVAREMSYQMKMTSMFDGYRGFLLDEFDKATKEARDRALEFIGSDRQAKGSIIIATSNLSVEAFDALEKNVDARSRLSSRFQVHHVGSPSAADAIPLIARWLPEAQAKAVAIQSATNDQGKLAGINTRGLLKDIESLIMA